MIWSQFISALPTFELTRVNLFLIGFGIVLMFAIFGSTILYLWEKCVLSIRRRRERNAFINMREQQMNRQLRIVAMSINMLKMSASRGIDHSRMMCFHATHALYKYSADVDRQNINAYEITMDDMFAVLLAAMLHIVDDCKYFPSHRNFENAHRLMNDARVARVTQDAVIRMIKYTACTKNIPDEVKRSPWVLIPKYCNQLEATGWAGIVRTHEFAMESHSHLSMPETLRAVSRAELWKIATPARYKKYLRTGKFRSMMDHFYDNLLHLNKPPMNNKYLDQERTKRLAPMVTFCLIFGRAGTVNRQMIAFAKEQSRIEARGVIDRVNTLIWCKNADGAYVYQVPFRDAIAKIMDM